MATCGEVDSHHEGFLHCNIETKQLNMSPTILFAASSSHQMTILCSRAVDLRMSECPGDGRLNIPQTTSYCRFSMLFTSGICGWDTGMNSLAGV